jgi:8-oxo-dGTP diphosphatase
MSLPTLVVRDRHPLSGSSRVEVLLDTHLRAGTVRLMNVRRVAGMVAVHQDRVALVRQHWHEYREDFWTIPGGALRTRETPAQGAVRELAEETGLVLSVERLRLLSTSSTAHGENRWLAWNFTATVEEPHLAVADPDGEILEARWFRGVEAVQLLDRLPYRPLREPVVAHLRGGQVLGSHWRYDSPDVEAVVTVGSRA